MNKIYDYDFIEVDRITFKNYISQYQRKYPLVFNIYFNDTVLYYEQDDPNKKIVGKLVWQGGKQSCYYITIKQREMKDEEIKEMIKKFFKDVMEEIHVEQACSYSRE